MSEQFAVLPSRSWLLAGILTLLLPISALVGAQEAAKSEPEPMDASRVLDGKTFVTLGEDPDELIFEDGTFFSASCAQWGFEPSPLIATIDGDVIRFQTESLSPKHGKMVWQGTVEGETLNVSQEWTKKRWYWKDAHQVKELQAILKGP